MRVVLIGVTGQLGSDLVYTFGQETLHPLGHDDLEVCDHAHVREVLTHIRPDVGINTTAFHNVDICEDRVEESFAVNTFAVRNLAQVCKELGCLLVHFSTDYVFNGDKGSPNAEAPGVFLHHRDPRPSVRGVHHDQHRTAGSQNRAQRP